METTLEREALGGISDERLAEIVRFADPMTLRGLLYYLTGDESLAAVPTGQATGRAVPLSDIVDQSARELIWDKALDLLKRVRDGDFVPPQADRAHTKRALELAAGEPIPDDELEMWIEQTAFDPWSRTFSWPAEPPRDRVENFTVAVIGTGIGGLNAAISLKRAGIPYFVIEKNADIGGTWLENTYPGARVDSASRVYSHIFGIEYEFPYAFCPQAENLEYLRWVTDKFGLREGVEFETEVTAMEWDEAGACWHIKGRGPTGDKQWRANAVISSVGFLSRPQLPEIPGMDSFAGPMFHTARWRHDVDLAGKRVGLVGSGASGYQLAPVLAEQVGSLTIFQRTPSWCFDVPGYLSRLPEALSWLNANVPFLRNFSRFRTSYPTAPHLVAKSMRVEPGFEDEFAMSEINRRTRDDRLAFMRRKLGNREDLLAKMTPKAPPNSARSVFVDPENSVFDALLRENVELVSDPIERIVPDGIQDADGTLHHLDAIVLATGFKANEFLWPMKIKGKGGITQDQLWAKDGPRAYIGAMMPGFPNFFMLYGPNTNNFGGLQIVDFEEMTTRFALGCIAGLILEDKRSVDVGEDAYWRYNAIVDEYEAGMIYKDPRVKTYYTNEFGRSAANCAVDVRRIWHWLRNPARRPQPGEEDASEPRPYFGEDLIVD